MKNFKIALFAIIFIVSCVVGVMISYKLGMMIRPTSNWFVAYLIGSTVFSVGSTLFILPIRVLVGSKEFDDAIINWSLKVITFVLK